MINVEEARKLMYNYHDNYRKEVDVIEEDIVSAATAGKEEVKVVIPRSIKEKIIEMLKAESFTVTYENLQSASVDITISWRKLPF